MVNVNLGSYYEEIVKRYLQKGYAGSKVELLRMALREFDRRERKQDTENEEINLSISENANRDIWQDPHEDEIWDKY